MTDGVTAVIEKIKGSADGMAARFTKVQDKIAGATGSMKAFGAQSNGAVKGVGRGIQDEILAKFQGQLPGSVSNVVGLLGGMAGPITVAAGLAAGLVVGLNKAVDAATAFGVSFRDLRNLNLDKTDAELKKVNDRILDIAWNDGLDPTAVLKGVTEIQSTMGEFGPEVERTVARIGVASRAMNVDMGSNIAGIAKALVQFKMPLREVDKLMESNAKTVNVGVVTYEELADVQTQYAGAASGANQKMDTANKLFALLTTGNKNARISATMLSSAFQDLGSANTADTLKKIGVNVFDANGQMRQADEIVKDLVPRFGKMSDQTFSQLKEELGGGEGLRGLLDMVKGSGDNVLRVFNDFDGASANIDDTISRAANDLDVMNDIMDNKVKTSWVQLGQEVMPMWIKIKGAVNEVILGAIEFGHKLGEVVDWFKEIYAKSAYVRYEVQKVVFIVKAAWEVIVATIQSTLNAIMTPIKAIGQALSGEWSAAWDTVVNGVGKHLDIWADAGKNVGHAFNGALDEVVNGGTPVKVAVEPEVSKDAYAKVSGAAGGSPSGNGPTPAATLANDPYAGLFGGKDGKKKGSNTSAGLGGVGGGSQVRNVTITINKLVERIEVRTTGSVKEGLNSIRAQVEEAIVDIVRGSEATLANG